MTIAKRLAWILAGIVVGVLGTMSVGSLTAAQDSTRQTGSKKGGSKNQSPQAVQAPAVRLVFMPATSNAQYQNVQAFMFFVSDTKTHQCWLAFGDPRGGSLGISALAQAPTASCSN
jgi:hypothetical protein